MWKKANEPCFRLTIPQFRSPCQAKPIIEPRRIEARNRAKYSWRNRIFSVLTLMHHTHTNVYIFCIYPFFLSFSLYISFYPTHPYNHGRWRPQQRHRHNTQKPVEKWFVVFLVNWIMVYRRRRICFSEIRESVCVSFMILHHAAATVADDSCIISVAPIGFIVAIVIGIG